MADGLTGISCQKNGSPPAKNPKMLENNVESIGKSMGMDKECVRLSKMRASQASKAGRTKIGPFGMGGSTKWSGSSSSLAKDFEERGCGSLIMTCSDVLNAASRMSCTINSTASESSVAANASSTVEISVSEEASDKLSARLERMIARLQDRVLVVRMGDAKEEDKTKAVEFLESSLARLTESLDQIGVLDVRGSTIRAQAGVKVKVIAKATSSQTQKLEEDYKTITAAAADNAIKQQLGESATQANSKKLVTQRVNNVSEDIRNDISTTLTQSKVSVNASGSVKLTAPKAIRLVDTTVDANVSIDLAVSAMAGNAMEIGRTIGNEIASELATQNASEQESSSGLADIAQSQTDQILGTVKAGTSSPLDALSGTMGVLAVGVLLLLLAGGGAAAFVAMRRRRKKGEETEAAVGGGRSKKKDVPPPGR